MKTTRHLISIEIEHPATHDVEELLDDIDMSKAVDCMNEAIAELLYCWLHFEHGDGEDPCWTAGPIKIRLT